MNTEAVPVKKSNYIIPITVIGILFFIFGFVTWINSSLIVIFKTACELNDFQVYFVTFAFYISYFVMALPSSAVLKVTGFRNGMSVGLWVMAIGALIFMPAAIQRSYGLFLTGLFVLGTGLALLQTAANPYVTIIGPRESAAKRISIMGICNKVAGAIAPVILTSVVFKDSKILEAKLAQVTDVMQKNQILNELSHRMISPYIIMAVILFALGFMVRIAHLPDINEEEDSGKTDETKAAKKSVFQYPNLVLGVIALFFYVGVEVMAGDTIIRYGQSLGIPMESAKYFASLTMMGMVIGYILGIILIPKYLKQGNALKICASLGIVLSLGAIFAPANVSLHIPFRDMITFEPVLLTIPITAFFVATLGFANSLVWPAMWPLALAGLGKFTKIASALLIMAMAGGALIPLAYGRLAVTYSTQSAYWIMVPCYAVILLYALYGSKLRSWSRQG